MRKGVPDLSGSIVIRALQLRIKLLYNLSVRNNCNPKEKHSGTTVLCRNGGHSVERAGYSKSSATRIRFQIIPGLVRLFIAVSLSATIISSTDTRPDSCSDARVLKVAIGPTVLSSIACSSASQIL